MDDPTSTSSQDPPPPVPFLALPPELLTKIARNVAPLGGKKAASLRLVCRQLAEITTPIVLACIVLPAFEVAESEDTEGSGPYGPPLRTEPHDRLAEILRDLPRWTSLVKSIEINGLPDPLVASLFYSVLKLLEGVRRLRVAMSSWLAGGPDVLFFDWLEGWKQIEILEMHNVDFDFWEHLGPTNTWTRAPALALSGCHEVGFLFNRYEIPDFARRLDSLDISGTGLDAGGVLSILWACSSSTSSIAINWGYLDEGFIDPEREWPSMSTRPPLALTGLRQLFDSIDRNRQSFSVSQVAKVLNWVTPLHTLTLSFYEEFDISEAFSSLALSNLNYLSLIPGDAAVSHEADFLTGITYKHLFRLLRLASLPALITLHLRGWVEATNAATLAKYTPEHLPPTTPSYLHSLSPSVARRR